MQKPPHNILAGCQMQGSSPWRILGRLHIALVQVMATQAADLVCKAQVLLASSRPSCSGAQTPMRRTQVLRAASQPPRRGGQGGSSMHCIASMPGHSSATQMCCIARKALAGLPGRQSSHDHRLWIKIKTLGLTMMGSLCMQAASGADCCCARSSACGAQRRQGPAASAPGACTCTLQPGNSAARRPPAAPSGAVSAAACPASGAAHGNRLHSWVQGVPQRLQSGCGCVCRSMLPGAPWGAPLASCSTLCAWLMW